MDPLKDRLPDTPKPFRGEDPESEAEFTRDDESEHETGDWRRFLEPDRESDPDGVMKPLIDLREQREE